MRIPKRTIISFVLEYVILTYIVIRFRLKAPKQRVQGGFYFFIPSQINIQHKLNVQYKTGAL